jgi:hypothetical protein
MIAAVIADPPVLPRATPQSPDVERGSHGQIIYPAFIRPKLAPVPIERDAQGNIIYPSTDFLPMSWTPVHYIAC